jgi:hypothetical protein
MSRKRTRRAPRRAAALWGYAVTALLGLPARRAPEAPAARRPRDPGASSYEATDGADNELQFNRAYWLPPHGRGNGLEALFWAPLAELAAERIDRALDALRAEGIPAWAAVSGRERGTAATPSSERHHDLWVGSADLDRAQDVLMRVLRS